MSRWKVTVEIQDGWRKDAEGNKNVENKSDKFWFSFRESLLFYNAFFLMNVKK